MKRLKRFLYLSSALSLMMLLTLAPTAEAQNNQKVVTVSIRDFFFDPANITVAPGTTVRWVNQGNAPHTVTANDKSFDSERLNPGQSFTHTFQGAGTFSYFCEIHPHMTASVSVNASGGGASGAAAKAGMAKAGGNQAMPAMAKAGGSQAKAKALPKTGGLPFSTSLLGLGAGILLVVGGGLLVRKVMR
jgi:plastocyanin